MFLAYSFSHSFENPRKLHLPRPLYTPVSLDASRCAPDGEESVNTATAGYILEEKDCMNKKLSKQVKPTKYGRFYRPITPSGLRGSKVEVLDFFSYVNPQQKVLRAENFQALVA